MGRKTRVVGFSVAPEIADEYEALAKRQGRSKSELFRLMVAAYRTTLEEQEFFALQKRMARKVRRKGIFSEREVERIVFEDR